MLSSGAAVLILLLSLTFPLTSAAFEAAGPRAPFAVASAAWTGSELVAVEEECIPTVAPPGGARIATWKPGDARFEVSRSRVPVVRSGATLAAWGTDVFVLGGRTDCPSYLVENTLYRYDVDRDILLPAGALPDLPHEEIPATSRPEGIYSLGGRDGRVPGGPLFSEPLIFTDPATGVSARIATLPEPRAAFVEGSDEFLVLNYNDLLRITTTPSVTFETLIADLPFDGQDVSAAAIGDDLYFFGGCCNSGRVLHVDLATGSHDLAPGEFRGVEAAIPWEEKILLVFGDGSLYTYGP